MFSAAAAIKLHVFVLLWELGCQAASSFSRGSRRRQAVTAALTLPHPSHASTLLAPSGSVGWICRSFHRPLIFKMGLWSEQREVYDKYQPLGQGRSGGVKCCFYWLPWLSGLCPDCLFFGSSMTSEILKLPADFYWKLLIQRRLSLGVMDELEVIRHQRLPCRQMFMWLSAVKWS